MKLAPYMRCLGRFTLGDGCRERRSGRCWKSDCTFRRAAASWVARSCYMRTQVIVFALSMVGAVGQDVTRVFQLHHIDKEQDQHEFATMVRTISDISKVSADTAQKTLSVSGTA